MSFVRCLISRVLEFGIGKKGKAMRNAQVRVKVTTFIFMNLSSTYEEIVNLDTVLEFLTQMKVVQNPI